MTLRHFIRKHRETIDREMGESRPYLNPTPWWKPTDQDRARYVRLDTYFSSWARTEGVNL